MGARGRQVIVTGAPRSDIDARQLADLLISLDNALQREGAGGEVQRGPVERRRSRRSDPIWEEPGRA